MKQPKGLYLLNAVSMWECFSYYGMRALLVLYMTEALGFSDAVAIGIYALYTTLVELGGPLGGLLADRLLGLRRAILIGGLTIALGHIALSIPDQSITFYAGLLLIVVGTALFRSNVATLLGLLYEGDDPRRDAGFTLYYAGINLGGFLAAISCGTVGELFGWHWGFGLAAVGMLSGLLLFILFSPLLGEKGKSISPKESVSGSFNMSSLLGGFIVLLILFYACEEQIGSSLVLFADRFVNREVAGFTIPASTIVTLNPLTILLLGPLVARFIQWRGEMKMVFAFLLLAAAFFTLYLTAGEAVSLFYVVVAYLLIAVAELFVGPTVYSLAASSSSPASRGLVMGFVTMGFSLASFVGGWISQGLLADFASGFLLIGVGATVVASVVYIIFTRKRAHVQSPVFE